MTKTLRSPEIAEVESKMDSNTQVGPDTDSSSDELRRARLARGRVRLARVRSSRSRGQGVRAARRGRRQITVDRRDAVAARNIQLQERIHNMPEDSLRDLMFQLCQRNPSLVFDVLEESSRAQGGGHHSPARVQGQPDWCTCSYCREMPTQVERVCCGQTEQNCFSRLRDFDIVVLDELILHVARAYRQEIFAIQDDDDYNRANRHAGYRQYTLWQHGHLGAGHRRPIPSCCVWKIRDKYPNAFGQYRGYVPGRLG
ncbi:P2X purinoceptor 7-like [Saccostrea echinata]|uniref:P2X purinoceptor 7-like n=1 Tax=Saccostrea echinata TaxID=191078 RepID=UPI002A8383B0|nr:P2X purinoceptor 7-like [Saccostrea echinata]